MKHKQSNTSPNHYQRRLEERKQRLLARAAKLKADGGRYIMRAASQVAGIPPGQPILVDHHSARRHRRALKLHDSYMRKGVDAIEHAHETERRAASVGTAGISADNPSAIELLETKIDGMKDRRDALKRAGKAWSDLKITSMDDEKGIRSWVNAAIAGGLEKEDAANLLRGAALDPLKRGPIPPYIVNNIGSAIRSAQRRLLSLKEEAEKAGSIGDTRQVFESPVYGRGEAVWSRSENRFQLFFDSKPGDEERRVLKSFGFRWAQSLGCWQRMLSSGGAEAYASRLLKVSIREEG